MRNKPEYARSSPGSVDRATTDPLMAEERRQSILGQLQSDGRVIVGSLAKTFGVSQITIRKDLDLLAERGLAQRSHGGALLPTSSALFDPTLREKHRQHAPEKQRIGEAAAALVTNGSCVMLDSGTTTEAVARALRRFSSLTVITNAMNIASELASTAFDVILTGGNVRRNSSSLVGPIAEDVLKEVHADILFLGVDGFDLETGLTTPNLLEARVNRAMIASSRKVVAVCDSTKFGRRSLSRIAPVSALHQIITDRSLPEETAEALRNLDVEVTLA